MKAIIRFRNLSTAGRHELGDQIISSGPLRPLQIGSEQFLSTLPAGQRAAVCKEMTLKEVVGDANGVVLVCEDSLPAGDSSEIRLTAQELDRLISLATKWREAYSLAQGKAPGVTWEDLHEAHGCAMCGEPAQRGIQVDHGGPHEGPRAQRVGEDPHQDTVVPFCSLCQEFVSVVESGGEDEEDRPGADALPTLVFCQIHVFVKREPNGALWCAGRHLVTR